MKTTRNIFAFLLALCLAVLPCATAFALDGETVTDSADTSAVVENMDASAQTSGAAEATSTEDATEVAPRQTIGRLLAGRSNDFYGSGYVEVYLDSGNAWADIQAGTGGSTCTGVVTISVKFPNGEWYELGTVMANADHTLYHEFTYCPAGTYLFYFENTTSDWIQVYANIYD